MTTSSSRIQFAFFSAPHEWNFIRKSKCMRTSCSYRRYLTIFKVEFDYSIPFRSLKPLFLFSMSLQMIIYVNYRYRSIESPLFTTSWQVILLWPVLLHSHPWHFTRNELRHPPLSEQQGLEEEICLVYEGLKYGKLYFFSKHQLLFRQCLNMFG